MSNPAYVLGHSAFELERLARQERLIGGATHDYFQSAGLAAGMRVLDVGSGGGAAAMHAAELVGPGGQVIGTDLAPAAIAAASTAAAARGLTHLSFRQGDPTEMTFEQPFDAVVGRYVLLFQSDQAGMLRRLAKLVRPGGLIIFHEPDWGFVRSEPPAPAYDQACRWMVETFGRLGQNTNMHARLRRAFLDAGLGVPTMRMRALIGDAVTAEEWLRSVADLITVIAPSIAQLGLATQAEIGAKTLAERIVRDVAANSSIVIGRAEIGAWVRVDA
jgi:ubiquinone/menaquinone biosynthesis C-methylase UbiE